MSKPQNETKVVAWFFANKALIKFEDSEDSLSVSDKVMAISDFAKYPILKGDTVEVGIHGDEVTFLRKVKGAKKFQKKEYSAPKSTDSSADETKSVRIFAVAGNKKVVKLSKDEPWIPVSGDVQSEDYDKIGLVAGNTVTLTISNGEIVKVLSDTDSTKKEEVKETPIKKQSSFRDEDSTDKRTVLMVAKDIVVALINKGDLEKPQIKEAIDTLTKACYDALNNL